MAACIRDTRERNVDIRAREIVNLELRVTVDPLLRPGVHPDHRVRPHPAVECGGIGAG